MKVFVTGATGQLGHDVMRELAGRGHSAVGSGSRETLPDSCIRLDITDRGAVLETLERLRPDAVIHCAAWTAVDAAEEEAARETVDRINRLGTTYLAEAAKAVQAKLLYVSTDYVFSGEGERPWRPDGERFAPLNVYGSSKLEGERAVRGTLDAYFIVRTSWVFGLHGKNFVSAMLRAGRAQGRVRVVDDQIGTPTYTRDLARLLVDMIESDRYGCYHASNEGGYISWYEFCREIYRQAGLRTAVVPVSTEEYGRSRAARPKNSRLDKSKLIEAGFQPLPDWRDALRRYLEEGKAVVSG